MSTPARTTPQPYHLVALHEGSHAVVADALGFTVRWVEIAALPVGPGAVRFVGATCYGRTERPDSTRAANLCDWLAVTAAGNASRDFCAGYSVPFAADLDATNDLAKANHLLDLMGVADAKRRARILRREWERARGILAKRWDDVRALADALLAEAARVSPGQAGPMHVCLEAPTYVPTFRATPAAAVTRSWPAPDLLEASMSATVVATLFEYSIDGAAYTSVPASGFTVSRSAAGGADKVLTFRAERNGETITSMITIPAQVGSPLTPIISNVRVTSQNNTTDVLRIEWNEHNMPGGSLTRILNWTFGGNFLGDGGGPNTIVGVTSPYDHDDTGGDGHGQNLLNAGAGTPTNFYYQVEINDGSNVIAISGVLTWEVEV